MVLEIPNDRTYNDPARKGYYEMIILDLGIIYRPIMLLPKSMWETPKRLGTSFSLLNAQKAQLNNELTDTERRNTEINTETNDIFLDTVYNPANEITGNTALIKMQETTSVQSTAERPNNPRENRTPLGELPHYKMLGNLMHLSGRFHHLKREYFTGRSDEKELSEITTQPLLHSLVVQRNRLDKLGISLDEELSNAVSDYQFQSAGYNMSTMQNDNDEYGIRNRLYYVQRNVYKDGKCIYKHKEREMFTISVLRSKVDGENTACPNCGYQGKLSDFMNGCQACGTHFTIHDFEPKITDYEISQNAQLQFENVANDTAKLMLLSWFIVFPVVFLLSLTFQFVDALLNFPDWAERINTVFYYIQKITIPEILAVMILYIFLSILFMIRHQGYGEIVTASEKVTRLWPDFSVAEFCQNMNCKLRNIHLVDHAKQVDFFAKCSLEDVVSGYQDVISCDLVNLQFLDSSETSDGYRIKVQATARLFLYHKGKIHTRNEQIDFSVFGKKTVVDRKIKALRDYKCPNCVTV